MKKMIQENESQKNHDFPLRKVNFFLQYQGEKGLTVIACVRKNKIVYISIII